MPSVLPDLGVLVKELAENVQTVMVSLYDLQTSLINKPATDPNAIRSAFSELRKQLRDQWEDFRDYLQRCNAFGADVSTLADALETEDVADCLEFLTDMADSAKGLRSPNTKDVSTAYQNVRDLQTSASHNNATRLPSTRPRRKARNADLQAFIDANISAANPDGDKSLSDLDSALAGIKSNLEACSRFWTITSEECRSYLETLPNGSLKITPKEAERLIDGWTRYRECIGEAIISITKTIDAMAVELNSAHHSNSDILPIAGSHVSDDNSTRPLHVGSSVANGPEHNSLLWVCVMSIVRWFY